MLIGTKIKELRIRDGYSQEKLAEKIGVSFQAISKWENHVTMPDITMLPVLAKLFQVSADELLGLTDEKTRKEDIEKEYAQVSAKAETTMSLLEMARKATEEFPDESKYWMWALENALQMGQTSQGEEQVNYLNEAITCADKVILLQGTGEKVSEALAGKMLAYILLGDEEKSLECVSNIEATKKHQKEVDTK